jgi:hypothetical protein
MCPAVSGEKFSHTENAGKSNNERGSQGVALISVNAGKGCRKFVAGLKQGSIL